MKFFFLFVFFILTPYWVGAQVVYEIKIDGTINPVTASFIHRSIEIANNEYAECLIIHLNTPGGLLKSTRVIVSDMLDTPIPIVVFVSPGGAHAGSAGVFITLAANIAAMAPGTNIGAAHPVVLQGQLDSIMNAKATNDAAAFIRSIAEKRKRNLEWAEEAVRRSLSITENEAFEKKVIDVIAKSNEDLLMQIDNKEIEMNSGVKTLHTKDARVETIDMGTSEKILDILSDPNIAYVLLLLGLYGIMFELYNPGAILPGIVGVICSIVAFYSMHTLPINYAGLALIIVAIILFLLEIKIVSHGILAIGGIVSLLLGSMMLVRPGSSLEFVKISWTIIISSVTVSALFFLFVLGLGLKAQRLKPVTGTEGMIGEIGEAIELIDPAGTVRVHGEIWEAESNGEKINQGDKVKVIGIKNLKLRISHFK
ncbi:MAG: nodulation protein NfeD [Bacteroidota bacterium]